MGEFDWDDVDEEDDEEEELDDDDGELDLTKLLLLNWFIIAAFSASKFGADVNGDNDEDDGELLDWVGVLEEAHEGDGACLSGFERVTSVFISNKWGK